MSQKVAKKHQKEIFSRVLEDLNAKSESAPEVQYRKGSIMNVKLENFMVHRLIEFQPDPGLNMIIGPNGSGKSCLVCGICLGLNGSTDSLGRGDALTDFIIRDPEINETSIELTLAGDPESENFSQPTVLKRVITRVGEGNHTKKSGGSISKWFINGKSVMESQVNKLIAGFNIQVDNRCQFLAQDKVSSFAKLDACQLLVETEKAVDKQLYVQHQELIELRKSELAAQQNVTNDRRELESLQLLQEQSNKELQRFELRKENEEKVNVLSAQLLWQKVMEAEELKQDAQNQLVEAEEELKQKQEKIAPILAQIQKLKAQAVSNKDIASKNHEHDSQRKKADEDRISKGKALEEYLAVIESKAGEIRNHMINVDKRRKKFDKCQQDLAALEEELASYRSRSEIKAEESEILNQMKQIRAVTDDLQGQMDGRQGVIDDLASEKKSLKQSIDKAAKSKEAILRIASTYQNVRDMYAYVQSNKVKFQGAVYGPLCCEIRVNSKLVGEILEQQVGTTMTAWVVENRHDQSILAAYKAAKVNVIMVDMNSRANATPNEQYLKECGADGLLVNMIDCPAQVKKALMDQFVIHTVAVASKLKSDQIQPLLKKDSYDKNGVDAVYTSDTAIRNFHSKYSGDHSSSLVPLRRGRYFTDATFVDNTDMCKRFEELIAQEKTLIDQKADLNELYKVEFKKHKQLDESLKSVKRDLLNVTNVENRIREQKKFLSTSSKDEDAVRKAEDKKLDVLNSEFKSLIAETCKYTQNVEVSTCKMIDIAMKTNALFAVFESSRATAIANGMEAQLEEFQSMFDNLSQKILNLKTNVQRLADNKKALQADAKAKAPLNHWAPIFASDKFKEYEQFTVLQLQDAIEIASRAAEAVFNDPHIIQDHHDRAVRIQALEDKLSNLNERHDNVLRQLEEKREGWESRLNEMVGKVNDQFKFYFDHIGCQGQVELTTDVHFEKYGLEIKVSFREKEGSLRALSANTQSGGEKSVSTMLFLLSLQTISDCPFRCVDEINQGMDASNERMIFEMIVKTSQCDDLPQYFVVTPKLLPDLPYPNDANIIFVMNGVYSVAQAEMKIGSTFSGKRKQLN